MYFQIFSRILSKQFENLGVEFVNMMSVFWEKELNKYVVFRRKLNMIYILNYIFYERFDRESIIRFKLIVLWKLNIEVVNEMFNMKSSG